MWKPTLRYQLTFEGAWPSAVAFLDSSRRLAAGNQNGDLYIWNLPETPPELPADKERRGPKREAPDVPPARRLEGHSNAISRLLFDPARKHLVSASFDRTIRLWPSDAPATGSAEVVVDADWRRSEFRRTKQQEVLELPGITVETQSTARVLEGHGDWIHSLATDKDGKRLISGDASAGVIVWDVDQGQVVNQWKGHAWNWIVSLALSADGQTALVSEYRYKRDDFDIPAAALKLWNVTDGTEKLDILKVQFEKLKPEETSYGAAQTWRKFVSEGLVATAFSPDGKLIAAGQGGETEKGVVHLIDAESGKLVRDISGHQYGVCDLAFSKDGKYLFSAGRDTCVRICQVEDGKEVAVAGSPRGGQFKDWVAAIALSPDETHLAAADIAGHVSVWQLRE